MSKTLEKLANARTNRTHPVCASVLVQGGRCTAMDFDSWLTMPDTRGLADGLYHAEGFAVMPTLRTGCAVADYPVLEASKYGDVIGRAFWLDADDLAGLAWARRAASTEETRYYMGGLAFNGDEVVGCDGNRLHIYTLTAPGHEGGWDKDSRKAMILPSAAFDTLMRMVKEIKVHGVTVTVFENGFLFQAGGCSYYAKKIDGTYPDYRRTVPERNAGAGSDFIPAEFKAILPELRVLAKIGTVTRSLPVAINGTGVARASGGKTWPVSVRLEHETGFSALFLADACAGTFYAADNNYGPCRIEGANRMTVIMPVRI